MTKDRLKAELQQIKDNNYIINHENLYHTYALDMLKNIGVTDPILRDELIYNIFFNWMKQDRFSPEQMESYLMISKDEEHLMYQIGTKEDDTVFTRTFSALIVGLVLYKNNKHQFLSEQVVVDTKNTVMQYYVKEKDLRGYVDKYGWAHSAAHGADVIDELAKCSMLMKDDLMDLLRIMQMKICQGDYVFIDGEPDRMCVAVRSIVRRKLIDDQEIICWLDSFINNDTEPYSITYYHHQMNIQNFFKSLYFTLKVDAKTCVGLDDREKVNDLIHKIESLITIIND